MRTTNPFFKQREFSNDAAFGEQYNPGVEVVNEPGFVNVAEAQARMTVSGAVNKTFFLMTLLIGAAAWTWYLLASGSNVVPWIWGGLLGGAAAWIITQVKPTVSMYTAPIYAIFEGLLLGALSGFFEARYPGIVIHAVGLTIGTLLCMLIAYRSGIIRVTQKFMLGVVAATGAIALIYVVDIVLYLFGASVPFVHSSGSMGILFSVFVVVIAALNLVLDFHFFEVGERNGAPKYMEWYAAFGLLVTLVWLYLEILRLLSKLRER
jgi:uncharacterized YccA/Bax inhibitor family protein